MSTATASLFFAVLTVAANLATVGLVALALVGPRARPDGLVAAWSAVVGEAALWGAFLVALVTMAGSLWFSEVVDLVPCTLCWYQRIALYPLVPILFVGALTRDRQVWRYAVPLAVIGGGVSTYHYLVEWFPDLDAGACSTTVPCTLVWFRRFGFMSLPYMALSSAVLIGVLVLWARAPSMEDVE